MRSFPLISGLHVHAMIGAPILFAQLMSCKKSSLSAKLKSVSSNSRNPRAHLCKAAEQQRGNALRNRTAIPGSG
jgi:hypothetical protein